METKKLSSRPWRRLVALGLGLALWPALASAQGCADSDVVESFQQTLISLAGLDYEQRYQRLAEPVRESHDLTSTLRIATGRHWSSLTEQQRASLIETFGRLSVATYADRFTIGENASFEMQSRQARGQQTAVRSVLKRPGEESIQFDYVLHRRDGQCRIVNIVADGVSDLALKRAEYTSVLGQEGFDALLAQLQAKVDEYGVPTG